LGTPPNRRDAPAAIKTSAGRSGGSVGAPIFARALPSATGTPPSLNTPPHSARALMTHATDVPHAALLPRLASELRDRKFVEPPVWASFVKTGVHKQRAPTQGDWWYVRSASVLRKIYVQGTTGVARLSAEYGGKKDRGSAPYHARTGSRAILREIVHQLEKSGLVQPYKNRGRRLSPQGLKLLDGVSREVLTKLAEKRPDLAKYL